MDKSIKYILIFFAIVSVFFISSFIYSLRHKPVYQTVIVVNKDKKITEDYTDLFLYVQVDGHTEIHQVTEYDYSITKVGDIVTLKQRIGFFGMVHDPKIIIDHDN